MSRRRAQRFSARFAAAALVAGGTVLVVPATGTAAPVTETFEFSGEPETFPVPDNVCEVTVEAFGAEGGTSGRGEVMEAGGPGARRGDLEGGPGGLGAGATATIAVTPGETLQVNVGGAGDPGDGPAGGDGGFNGGGDGGDGIARVDEEQAGPGRSARLGGLLDGAFGGGGGGGASDVRQGGTTLDDRVVVGGGGGGAGDAGGGGGGGETGDEGGGTNGGGGGTETDGGPAGGNADPGELGDGGDGGDGSILDVLGEALAKFLAGSGPGASVRFGIGPPIDRFALANGGGGGGGGRFGGGGGGGGTGEFDGGGGAEGTSGPGTSVRFGNGELSGGGGGGSGLVPAGGTFEEGVREGDGLVTITYDDSGASCPAAPTPPAPTPPAPTPPAPAAAAPTPAPAVVTAPVFTG